MAVAVTNLDFGNNSRALNLLNPTNNQDAATKIYVDNSVNISNGMIVTNEFTTLTTSGTNWAIGDNLVRFQIVSTTGTITSTVWYTSSGTVLSTPPVVGIDCEDIDKSIVRLNNKLSIGSQALPAALSVASPRRTTITGFTTTATTANTNLLDPSGAGAYTDIRDFNNCCIVITLPSGAVSYNIQTSMLSTGAVGSNFAVDTYGSTGLKFSGVQTSSAAGVSKIFVSLADANYIRVNVTAGSTIGLSASMYCSGASFQIPAGVVNISSLNFGVGTQFLEITGTQAASIDTAAISISNGTSARFDVIASAFNGSGNLLISIQDTSDGTNWNDLYVFPPLTANGTYRSPLLPITRGQFRYSFVNNGSSSFALSIYRTTNNHPGLYLGTTKRNSGFNALNTAVDLPLGGRTTKIVISNSTAVVYFLQIHNVASSATVVAAGATPTEVTHIAANATLRLADGDFGEEGTAYGNTTAITTRMVISSTFGTYTAIAIAAKALAYVIESI